MDARLRRRTGHAHLRRSHGHAASRIDGAYVDCFQIGARNMQNFDLLREVGKTRKPVLLKRGLAASVKDWLLSAEYVLSQGNRGVILCERGIKTFEDSSAIRWT
jgi:3-deoxy-D-arabino-heptulosonate 7-phosphate (DAHP) synthase